MAWTRWNGDSINGMIKDACIRAVDKTAHVVLSASNQEVPLDEGFLLRSGIVITRYDRIAYSIISYGGGPGTGHPKIPYAIRWHENMANFQHGRKWKYLKDPFSRIATSELLEKIKNEIRGVL